MNLFGILFTSYKWKNYNSKCNIFLTRCSWKLLLSKKIAEFSKYWKISLILHIFKEGKMWYVLYWYESLDPRICWMYKCIHFTLNEIEIVKYNIPLIYYFLAIDRKIWYLLVGFVKNENSNYHRFLGFLTDIKTDKENLIMLQSA